MSLCRRRTGSNAQQMLSDQGNINHQYQCQIPFKVNKKQLIRDAWLKFTCHKGHTVCATGRLSLLPAILSGSVFQISKRSWRPAKVWSYIYSVHLFHHDQDHTNTLAHILTQYGLTYWWTRMPLALLVNRWCVWQQRFKKKKKLTGSSSYCLLTFIKKNYSSQKVVISVWM